MNNDKLEAEWRVLKDKTLMDFIESGALATNQCPNFLRDAYFKKGFKSASKLAVCREKASQVEIDEFKNEVDFQKTVRNGQEAMIQKLTLQLKKAEEVIGFYGNKDNWRTTWFEQGLEDDDGGDVDMLMIVEDVEVDENNYMTSAGKNARDYFKNKEGK